jgi:hypothetical protein
MGVTEGKAIMRRVFVTAMTLALLMGLMALPAVAGGPHDKATGTVTWTARTHLSPEKQIPGIETSFNAHDVGPGMDDKGTLTTYRPADTNYGFTGGSLTMDLKCVNVDDNQAWFAGVVSHADGEYSGSVGDYLVYHVLDVATSGSGGDEIGGNAYSSLATACVVAEAGSFIGKGVVMSGNLRTHTYDS